MPEENLLTLESTYQFNDFKKITEIKKIIWEEPEQTALAAFLMETRAKKSNWSPYFDMFPIGIIRTNPLFFKEQEFEYLIGTDFLGKLQKEKDLLKKDYDILISNILKYSIYSFEEFCLNRLIIAGRAFGFTDGHLEKTQALVPFADFINIGAKKNVNCEFDRNKNCFEFSAINDIKKGEALTINSSPTVFINFWFFDENHGVDGSIQ